MDWRLQGAGLTIAIIFASLPSFFAPAYNGNQTAFASSWNTVVSAMQYLVIASLVLATFGIVWRGPVGRASAWIQMFISVGIGSWMLLVAIGLAFTQAGFDGDCCRQLIPIVAPAQNLVAIGLLIPTLSFASSLAWLFWDGRHRLEASTELSAPEIRRIRFAETIESIVSSVVAPIMLVFGVTLILVTSSAILWVVGIGIIAFSIIVFVLQLSRQIKGLK